MKKLFLTSALALVLTGCGQGMSPEEEAALQAELNLKVSDLTTSFADSTCPDHVQEDMSTTCGDYRLMMARHLLSDANTDNSLKTILWFGALEKIHTDQQPLQYTLEYVNTVCEALTAESLAHLERHGVNPRKACAYYENMSYQKI